MRKVVIHRAGGYDQLRLEEHNEPRPSRGDVRIAVRAIGINYADCIVRMGLYESAKKYVGWPITPGFEVAGVVDALGPDVTEFREGDEVFAVTRFGGYASSLVVPVHQVRGRPAALSMEQAAAFPSVHLTAWYALHALAHVTAGESVLVHSAAGGVGTAALQLARAAGLNAVGVVGGSHKVETVRQLGAEPVDKSRENLWRRAKRLAPEGYDVVLDANGVETLGQSYAHLGKGGRLIIYGFHTMLPRSSKGSRGAVRWAKLAWGWLRTPRFNPLALTGDNRSVMGFNLSYMFEKSALLVEGMDALLAGIEAGDLQGAPVTTYPLDRVADAQRDLESGQTIGKLVLVP